jgi:hypothetical protein
MYSLLPVIGREEAYARGAAMTDRAHYAKFMEAAEKFAIENELVVGGAGGIRLLLGNPEDPAQPPLPDLDAFQYDFYSSGAVAAARKLGEVLYMQDPEGLGHYTTVLTKIPGVHLAIEVDGRSMFTITSLPAYRGVKISDVVIPSYRPPQFARKESLQIACLGPELQLMDLYAALCNPGRASDWGKLLATEVQLRALFQREIRGKFTEALRASREGGRASDARRRNFYRDLYEKFAVGPGRVLIGPAAVQMLRLELRPELRPEPRPELRPEYDSLFDYRIQLVTIEPLDSEAKELARLAKLSGLELQWAVHDPKIPTDPRLRRLTAYIAGSAQERREPVLDIYNAAAHELVPFVTAQALLRDSSSGRGKWHPPAAMKVGTPFVLLRFRLADIWTIQVLLHMKSLASTYAANVLLEMLNDYEAVAAAYEALLREPLGDVVARLMPASSYVGRLESPDLALKRAALSRPGAKFHAPYLPASRARDNNRGDAEKKEEP